MKLTMLLFYTMKKLDVLGNKFGRWTIIKAVPYTGTKTTWLCRCECGTTRKVRLSSLRNGDSVSCGCYAEELKTKYESGKGTDTPEYWVWSCMIQRCHNPKASSYHNYGGRGIKVCQEWKDSFLKFFNHIGSRPTPTHSIDRINNDGNYEPGNVRWATRHEQNLNTRRTKR